MKHLKIFQVESIGNALVVTPQGEGSAFRYQDLHLETNTVRSRLATPEAPALILDLSQIDYFGSEFIGALVSLLRETRVRKGKACFCAANDQMLQVLRNMSLFKLWPYYETREEAQLELTSVPT